MDFEKFIMKDAGSFGLLLLAIICWTIYKNYQRIFDVIEYIVYSLFQKYNSIPTKQQLIRKLRDHNVFFVWRNWVDYGLATLNEYIFVRELSTEEKIKRLWCIRKISSNNVEVFTKHIKKWLEKVIKEHSAERHCGKKNCKMENKYLTSYVWGQVIRDAYIEFYDKTVSDGVPETLLEVFYEFQSKYELTNVEYVRNLLEEDDKNCFEKIIKIFDQLEAEARMQNVHIMAIANLNGRVTNALKNWTIPENKAK